MDRPVARPARTPPADPALAAVDPAADASPAASPQQRRNARPKCVEMMKVTSATMMDEATRAALATIVES